MSFPSCRAKVNDGLIFTLWLKYLMICHALGAFILTKAAKPLEYPLDSLITNK